MNSYSTYQCKQLQGTQCLEWVQATPSTLESLAITKQDAYDITIAILALLMLGFTLGLFGRFFKEN